ncbi:MAG: rhodanese-like domain-containing protein [Burkholderiales bacterium]|nr:rhodanese-like domain-containing protein [Burkholderiales bacterium]
MQHDPAFEQLVNEIRPHIKECTITDIKKRLDNNEAFVLIDVREDHEWVQSRIPQAIHLGRGIIERDIGATVTDKNTEIVLYCGGGFRSALSAFNLTKMGYTNVISMDGGVRAWKESGYSLES